MAAFCANWELLLWVVTMAPDGLAVGVVMLEWG